MHSAACAAEDPALWRLEAVFSLAQMKRAVARPPIVETMPKDY